MPNAASEAPASHETGTAPVATFRHRTISASVFENTSEKGNAYLNVNIQKRYQDKEGNWQTGNSFLRDELPVLEHLVRQAYSYILQQEANKPPQEK